ncbi:TMV resistance protein N isoform X4 [Lactuca sativa]|uniref:TMV resistance protein N isoform X4 n=1 Tax=Lactuca sativa TaxID=4236 RepID=UPI000CD9EEDE|nr:TMV resistance protein N isoform X4 [Lactuca sativa]
MASSSTSSNQKSFKYQVFLSFTGEDTRKTFVDHLYASLKQKGIHTFRDNEELEKGKRIDELFKSIEESRFFIIVFSKNYASSSWCLKEITKIMECQDGNQQIAYPLFYGVEPSDIRHQTGPVGRAIAKHKDNEQIKKWEKALEDAGNLVGWDLKNIANGHEAEAIKKIVEEISLKLGSIHLGNDEHLIGMEQRMQALEASLGIGLKDKARMIGIKGMGGIGKTTLARAIFDQISSHFEGSSFVADIREVSKKKGLESLQQQILSDVLKDERIVGSVNDGKRIMRTRLPYKKVLLVLDDVDDTKQLEALAGDWFKDGSRIIITTRDEKVLLSHRVNEKWIHDVDFLSDEEAIRLFSWFAFRRYIPDQGYEELAARVVHYADGLPLTIRVLGSHLCGENKDVWRDALKRLEKIPLQETLDVLEISYNSLEDDHKEIFLDVACFLNGISHEFAIRILESCGFHATYGLRILEHKSLVTISDGRLGMHDTIQELGKNIIRREHPHPHELNKHSRLWNEEEIVELLSDDEGTATSTCTGMLLLLLLCELSPEIIIQKLGNLKKLRYLCVLGNDSDCFPSDWKFDEMKPSFPNSLQYLI